ncbi:MAG: carbohydrate deacetylase [Thermoguttaceae bacterium]
MSQTINLIVNADDAGIAPAVNDAILDGARKNVISAASVMSNMPYAEEAVKLFTQQVPLLELGLHFCLTSGRPISDPKEIPLLVDSNGNFNRGFLGLLKLYYSRKRNDFLVQVYKELLAQLDWFAERDVPIIFIDGHQHIQMIPGIFEVVQEEAKKRDLHIRISDERIGTFRRFRKRFSVWFPGGFVKKWLLSHLSQRDAVALSILYLFVNKKPIISYHGVLDTGKFTFDAWQNLFESISYEISTLKQTQPLNLAFEDGAKDSGNTSNSDNASDSGNTSRRGNRTNSAVRTLLVNLHPATEEIMLMERDKFRTSEADKDFMCQLNRINEWRDLTCERFQKLLETHNVKIVGFGKGVKESRSRQEFGDR